MGKKLTDTDIPLLTEQPAAGDLSYIVDISSTSDDADGSSHGIAYSYLVPNGRLILCNADSDVTCGNTSDETTLFSGTIPAGTMSTTRGLAVTVTADLTQTDTALPLNIMLKLGSTTLCTCTASVADNDTAGRTMVISGWIFNTSATAQVAYCKFTDQPLNVASRMCGDHGTGTENTANALTLAVTAQWDSAVATATLTKKIAFVELLPYG